MWGKLEGDVDGEGAEQVEKGRGKHDILGPEESVGRFSCARAAPGEGQGREDQAEMEESRMNVEELIPMIAELFSS